jgi:predicted nucleic acid-binding protein
MRAVLVLDSGPLGEITDNPAKSRTIAAMARMAIASEGGRVVIPEITDYELRRELLRNGSFESVRRLDKLRESFDFDPITSEVMRLAAEFWADSRRGGRPTTHPHALDCDVILAAHATRLATYGDGVVVATTNVGHLGRFVSTLDWTAIPH